MPRSGGGGCWQARGSRGICSIGVHVVQSPVVFGLIYIYVWRAVTPESGCVFASVIAQYIALADHRVVHAVRHEDTPEVQSVRSGRVAVELAPHGFLLVLMDFNDSQL